MNKFKISTLIIIFVSLFLNSCSGIKDVLQGKKRSKQGDEFLVEKKNPLSMPPDYEKLPVPGEAEKEISSEETDSSEDIKKLLSLETSIGTDQSTNNQPGDIESSILKKIK
tara:strand:- start:284 stop:616 length:333 start_codon:yes stop_codon:yes gene_type:complete